MSHSQCDRDGRRHTWKSQRGTSQSIYHAGVTWMWIFNAFIHSSLISNLNLFKKIVLESARHFKLVILMK